MGQHSNWKPAEGHRRASFQGQQWGRVRVRPWASSDKFPNYRASNTLPTYFCPHANGQTQTGPGKAGPCPSAVTYQAGSCRLKFRKAYETKEERSDGPRKASYTWNFSGKNRLPQQCLHFRNKHGFQNHRSYF